MRSKDRAYSETTLAERLRIIEEVRTKIGMAAEACDGTALSDGLKTLSILGAELNADGVDWALVVLREHFSTDWNPFDALLAALAFPETPDVCKILLDAIRELETIEAARNPTCSFLAHDFAVSAARKKLPHDDACELLSRLQRCAEIVQLSPEEAEARDKLIPWFGIATASRAYRQHLRVRGLAATDEDRMLSKRWAEHDNKDNDWEQARCLSARLAERAAAEVYRRFGHEVRDIAIGQLNGDDDRWLVCDLVVDGDPVDVKNARKSQGSTHYVDHCVPSFKMLRNAEVRIAGVLSNYVSPVKLLRRRNDELSAETLFLGETRLARQRTLREWFAIPDLLDLQFGDPQPNTKSVVPSWMFDYPAEIYAARDGAIRALRTRPFPANNVFERAGIKPLPYAIAVSHPTVLDHVAALDGEARSFALYLIQAVDRLGLSLPVVFLAVLHHWVRSLRLPQDDRLPPAQYRDLVLLQGATRPDLPLGILDPLRTIPVLIDCLDNLHMQSEIDLSCFDRFRLSGVGILEGATATSTERWRTLVAYCGGWKPVGKTQVKCGHYPLILGKHQSCIRCHRLVCSECGYCSKNCRHW